MMKETWNEFRTETFLKQIQRHDRYLGKRKWEVGKRLKAIRFIDSLLKNGVSLDQIDINDWSCNVKPSVYVGSGRYSRLAKNDYKLALRRLKS